MVKFVRVVLGFDKDEDVYDMLLPEVIDQAGVDKACESLKLLLEAHMKAQA